VKRRVTDPSKRLSTEDDDEEIRKRFLIRSLTRAKKENEYRIMLFPIALIVVCGIAAIPLFVWLMG